VFDQELRTKAVARLATERMLRRALDDHHLVVEYQPIIDLRTSRPVAAEALLRVWHPEEGLLHPATFLEVAEETGLLVAMDDEVLADAVRQVSRWGAHPTAAAHIEVAVNITARHLADTGFPSAVLRHLDARGVPHGQLQIELTERVFMEASNSAMASLHALRDAGIQIGLDDFGTGYSSLAYLRELPLDFIKIDSVFVHDMAEGSSGRAVMGAIIELAHALDLTVVAEGVDGDRGA
jgi:EAL domain-containing protein (putative c-di-GMP-specific phosphodiesterase class I)